MAPMSATSLPAIGLLVAFGVGKVLPLVGAGQG